MLKAPNPGSHRQSIKIQKNMWYKQICFFAHQKNLANNLLFHFCGKKKTASKIEKTLHIFSPGLLYKDLKTTITKFRFTVYTVNHMWLTHRSHFGDI